MRERESEEMPEDERKVYFIPLEQSSPLQPRSHWHRSGATHLPWTHSLMQRAVDKKHDV